MNDLKSRLAKIPPDRLRALAQQLKKSGPASGAIQRQQRSSNRFPLAFAQERLWFLTQLAPENAAYNNTFAFRIQLRLDIAAMEKTFNEIVRRHEALRTTFELDGDKPVQVVSAPQFRPMEIVDLRHLPREEAQAEARRLAIVEAKTPFALQTGPIFRVKLLLL